MNVAFVHATPMDGSALARRTRRIARMLGAHDHDPTVLCTRWWDGDHAEFERDGVTYRAVSGSRRWFTPRLPGALAALAPEAIHAAGSEPGAVLAARFAGSPLVVDWCGEGSPRLLDRAFSVADRVHVPSEHVRTAVRERGADASVVPEPVPIGAIEGIEAAGSAALLWAGRLDKHAGLGGLLLALAEFEHTEWRTLVIGEGPERARYERLARDLRVAKRVDFVGELPSEQRIARMKGAHLFVHTADRCPFADDLVLALACGCVGIVEYRPDSAAHEPIAGHERGIGVTSEEGIVDAIESATDLPHAEYDARFERYSHRAVLETHLEAYRELGAPDGEATEAVAEGHGSSG